MILIPEECISWSLPPASPAELSAIPDQQLREYYARYNGLILFQGALHVRGLMRRPSWHDLLEVWTGKNALHHGYPEVTATDVPFAQDCVGDQFLIQHGKVLRLAAETGEIEHLGLDVDSFFALAVEDADEFLSVGPLQQLHAQGGSLAPGQLVSVMPPYVVKHEGEYNFRAIPVAERLAFLTDFAGQIREVPDGQDVQFKWTD